VCQNQPPINNHQQAMMFDVAAVVKKADEALARNQNNPEGA